MIRVTLRADEFARRLADRASPARSSPCCSPRPARRSCCRCRAGSSRPTPPSRSGATTPSAATTPRPGEIDVDVVLHEPRGLACTWANELALGAPVGYAGPRVDFHAPRRRGVAAAVRRRDGAARDRGDPRVAAARRARRRRRRGRRRARGAPARAARATPRSAGSTATARPPRRRSHLADALRDLPLPDGPGQAWGAAEPGSPATCAPSCARSAGCPAATSRRRATGCGRATGSSTRTDRRRSGGG